MPLPEEIFPEDKIDPTAGTKENEYHVERTLGVVGHVRTIAKKRQWRYLVQEGVRPAEAMQKIRDFYQLPESALVVYQGDTWAVWSGEGEPSSKAFEPETLPEATPAPLLRDGIGFDVTALDSAREYRAAWPLNSGPVHGTFPDEETLETRNGHSPVDPVLAEVAKNAPPGTVLESTQAEILKATAENGVQHGWSTNVSDNELRDTKGFTDTWAYSTKTDHLADPASMRARFKTRPDAPIETRGDIAAVWLGEGAPPRAAFPEIGSQPKPPPPNGIDKNGRLIPVPSGSFSSGGATDGSTCSVCGEPLGSVLRPGYSCMGPFHTKATSPGITQLTGDLDTRATKPVEVSPHVPSAALNDMGLKIYGLSKNPLFSKDFREYLVRVSDSLHAEAARIELAKVRKNFDSRNG